MTLQNPQDPSPGISLDTLISDFAMQPIFIGRLDSRLADVRRPSIVGLIDTIEFALVDAANIADDMDAMRSKRILPSQPRTDVDSGKSVPVDREPRDLPVFQPQAQRDLLETALAGNGCAERLFIRTGYLDDPA